MQNVRMMLFLLVLYLPFAFSALTVRPNDTTARVGDRVTFYCSTDLSEPVDWTRKSVGQMSEDDIYDQNRKILPELQDRFSFNTTSHSYNLIIQDVKLEDEAEYICTDNGGFGKDTGDYASAKLTVIEVKDVSRVSIITAEVEDISTTSSIATDDYTEVSSVTIVIAVIVPVILVLAALMIWFMVCCCRCCDGSQLLSGCCTRDQVMKDSNLIMKCVIENQTLEPVKHCVNQIQTTGKDPVITAEQSSILDNVSSGNLEKVLTYIVYKVVKSNDRKLLPEVGASICAKIIQSESKRKEGLQHLKKIIKGIGHTCIGSASKQHQDQCLSALSFICHLCIQPELVSDGLSESVPFATFCYIIGVCMKLRTRGVHYAICDCFIKCVEAYQSNSWQLPTEYQNIMEMFQRAAQDRKLNGNDRAAYRLIVDSKPVHCNNEREVDEETVSSEIQALQET